MIDPEQARDVLAHCRHVAGFTEVPGKITRTFLSEAARCCQTYLSNWMLHAGIQVHIDAAGNLHGFYAGADPSAGRILIASHLDTVPDAGPYDGVLGVVLGVSLVESLRGERLPFGIEVIGFSEEEGVRFGVPFLGSRALIGDLDDTMLNRTDESGITIKQAICNFGLDTAQLHEAVMHPAARAYLEFHIEQGPVLDKLGLPLGVVESIAGQSRASVVFSGSANHAGTTPMSLRQDALCAAAEWILSVEREARVTSGLLATVGQIAAKPNVGNVVPAEVRLSLDVRHVTDAARDAALAALIAGGSRIAQNRDVRFEAKLLMEQAAVPMDVPLTDLAERAIKAAGATPHRMISGAGHDAMIVAPKLPSTMIFLRSPGGISHHPDENVYVEDVALALRVGLNLLSELSSWHFQT